MKKIKASDMRPGMLVNIRSKKSNNYELITAVKGYVPIDYSCFPCNDPYNGQVGSLIKRDKKILLIEDKDVMNKSIEYILDELHKNLFDIERNIDLVKLIKEMSK